MSPNRARAIAGQDNSHDNRMGQFKFSSVPGRASLPNPSAREKRWSSSFARNVEQGSEIAQLHRLWPLGEDLAGLQ